MGFIKTQIRQLAHAGQLSVFETPRPAETQQSRRRRHSRHSQHIYRIKFITEIAIFDSILITIRFYPDLPFHAKTGRENN